MEAAMIKVAIIENDSVYRLGLARVIDEAPELELVLAARSVEDFRARAVPRPDVIILDLGLPGGGLEGSAAVRHLRDQDLRVLVVSVEDREVPVLDAIGAGASGYVVKEAEPDEIIRAVTVVAKERTYVSATLASYLLRAPIRLTEREKEILRLVASGETDRDIAEQLFITVKTVHGHLERIRAKTGLHNRVKLTRFAIERGFVPRESKEE
ncbi:MAG: response regulator transcription factor [Egibacteraceae bacterium]